MQSPTLAVSHGTRSARRCASALLALLCGVSLPLGCTPKTTGVSGAGSAAASSTPPPSSSVGRFLPRMALPSAEPPPAHQETVAVKFIGTVRPASSGKQRIVFASYEDCLGKSPSNIGQGEVAPDGSFKLEIFARWGADYTLCAVELAGEGKATQRYGKAARELSPREPGDVRFRDLVVELSQGPARSFPGPRPSGGF